MGLKPRIGIFGLSGCWGEQIVILNCEDELLALVGAVDIVDFLGGSSVNDEDGPLDIALVEGSVGTAREEAALKRIRERARLLVACGSCACFGGVAATEHAAGQRALAEEIYGPTAAAYQMQPHRPLGDFVRVDAALPGCPMEKDEFLRAVACLLNGDAPQPIAYPVCTECRLREQECLLIAAGVPCAGPVTLGGCHARCPGFNVPCIGCRGPVDDANLGSMQAILAKAGFSLDDIRQRLRTFAAPAVDAQREEARR